MDINELIAIVKKKIEEQILIQEINIEDIYRNIIAKLNNKLNNFNNNLFDINKLIRFIKLVFNANRIFNGEIIVLKIILKNIELNI